MHNLFHHPFNVLSFAAQQRRLGVSTALIIITKVTGGTMRAYGAMMCVTPTDVAGYVSNGCVDADIVFQARELLKTGGVKYVHYGEGSPFKDISLPCGGQIHLLISTKLGEIDFETMALDMGMRRAVELKIEASLITYTPPLRIRILGKGEAVRALSRQAISAGFPVVLQSPDPQISAGLSVSHFDHLTDPATPPQMRDDPWTAVVVMFHDHDWEPYILAQACRGPAFYIGAMGSTHTHDLRRAALKANGLRQDEIDRVSGPIGLIGSMRDANLLALSTLAEVIDRAQKDGIL
ncbi:MAG: XdhC family protein [Litorimonas sp.]